MLSKFSVFIIDVHYLHTPLLHQSLLAPCNLLACDLGVDLRTGEGTIIFAMLSYGCFFAIYFLD